MQQSVSVWYQVYPDRFARLRIGQRGIQGGCGSVCRNLQCRQGHAHSADRADRRACHAVSYGTLFRETAAGKRHYGGDRGFLRNSGQISEKLSDRSANGSRQQDQRRSKPTATFARVRSARSSIKQAKLCIVIGKLDAGRTNARPAPSNAGTALRPTYGCAACLVDVHDG